MALGEKSDLRLGQEIYKISLEYIVVAESKKVLKKKKKIMAVCQREIGAS